MCCKYNSMYISNHDLGFGYKVIHTHKLIPNRSSRNGKCGIKCYGAF